MKAEATETRTCDACDAPIVGEPAGYGELVLVRGDKVVREHPPLCARCAHAIGWAAGLRLELDEEG